jgi:ketosteroid isomerase-like protein
MRIGADWEGLAAVAHDFVTDGATVVALGEYGGTCKATGKSFKAPFAHVWKFTDGQVTSLQECTDTAVHRHPMQS